MRRAFALLLLLSASICYADSTTNRLGLTLPQVGGDFYTWGQILNQDFQIIDSTVSGNGQSNVYTSSNVFNGFVAFNGGIGGSATGNFAILYATETFTAAQIFNSSVTLSGAVIWNGQTVSTTTWQTAGSYLTTSSATATYLQLSSATASAPASSILPRDTGPEEQVNEFGCQTL